VPVLDALATSIQTAEMMVRTGTIHSLKKLFATPGAKMNSQHSGLGPRKHRSVGLVIRSIRDTSTGFAGHHGRPVDSLNRFVNLDDLKRRFGSVIFWFLLKPVNRTRPNFLSPDLGLRFYLLSHCIFPYPLWFE
jgi:hypothetical protein